MIEIAVPTKRVVEWRGETENTGVYRVYRETTHLRPEVLQWFIDTVIPPQYEVDPVLRLGEDWMTIFYFNTERDAALFKLAWA